MDGSVMPLKKNRPRDRTNESVSRSLQSVMRRLDHLNHKYGIDVYLCAKYKRYFEYTTTPSFRPTALDIKNSYRPVRRHPSDFGRRSIRVAVRDQSRHALPPARPSHAIEASRSMEETLDKPKQDRSC